MGTFGSRAWNNDFSSCWINVITFVDDGEGVYIYTPFDVMMKHFDMAHDKISMLKMTCILLV